VSGAGDRLADAVRELIEALAAEAPTEAAMDEAAVALRALTGRLRDSAGGRPRPYHFGGTTDGPEPTAYLAHSPVSGRGNPLAAPLQLEVRDGVVHGRGRFGRAYEGPPGCVHGAFVAAAFDDALGLANVAGGNPGLTTRLEVRYRRPTPLHADVEVECRHMGRDGRRIFAAGTMRAGGVVTAEAEGTFAEVTPERALELFAAWRKP